MPTTCHYFCAQKFGELMNKEPQLTGAEVETVLLSNSSEARRRFDPPRVPVDQMMSWIADWTLRGGANLGKPTHFEARDGKY